VANGILVFWDIFPWSLITVRGISIICGTGRRERELRKFLRRRADGVEKLGWIVVEELWRIFASEFNFASGLYDSVSFVKACHSVLSTFEAIAGDCRQLKGLKFLPFYLFCSLLLELLTLIWPSGLRRRLGCLSIPPLLICAKTTINKHVKRLDRRLPWRLAHVPTVGLHVLVLWRVSPIACYRVDAVAPDAYLKYHRNKLYSNLVVNVISWVYFNLGVPEVYHTTRLYTGMNVVISNRTRSTPLSRDFSESIYSVSAALIFGHIFSTASSHKVHAC
jgi:hypothetical protein